jgi:hypothetical protein
MELGITLYAHPRLHSRDSEAVREFLRGNQLDFEVLGRGASGVLLDTHINALYMPDGSYLSYVQYGAAAQTRSGPAAGDYAPERGLQARSRGLQPRCARAAALDPARRPAAHRARVPARA